MNSLASPFSVLDDALDELYSSLPKILGQSFPLEKKTGKDSLHKDRAHNPSDIFEEINLLRRRCQSGLRLILEELKRENPSSHLAEEMTMRFRLVTNRTQFTRMVLRVVEGRSWRDSLDIPVSVVRDLYDGARRIFDSGRFADAVDCFTFLAWFESRQYDFWIALGHAQFHCARYSAAISAYGVASQCLPEESFPHIYSAGCFESLGDIENAIACMRDGLECEQKKNPQNRDLIETLRNALENYSHHRCSPIS